MGDIKGYDDHDQGKGKSKGVDVAEGYDDHDKGEGKSKGKSKGKGKGYDDHDKGEGKSKGKGKGYDDHDKGEGKSKGKSKGKGKGYDDHDKGEGKSKGKGKGYDDHDKGKGKSKGKGYDDHDKGEGKSKGKGKGVSLHFAEYVDKGRGKSKFKGKICILSSSSSSCDEYVDKGYDPPWKGKGLQQGKVKGCKGMSSTSSSAAIVEYADLDEILHDNVDWMLYEGVYINVGEYVDSDWTLNDYLDAFYKGKSKGKKGAP
jgi:hypothetical protein